MAKGVVEDYPALDVNRLNREQRGLLEVARDAHLPLTLNDGTPIVLDWTPCTYGGLRPWFLCPRCTRRCARLVSRRGLLGCRACFDLRYATQGADAMGRSCYRAFAIRARLGGRGSLDDTFPAKPRGMHWRTYERLREREQRALGVWTTEGLVLLDKMAAALGGPSA